MENDATENLGLEEHLDEQTCKMVSEFFSVYANPIRISIFCALRDGPKTVSELAEHANVSLQNVSQHLRLMHDKGAVQKEKSGHHVYYAVADPKFIMGVKMIRDALMEGLYRRAGSLSGGAPAPPREGPS